MKPGIIVSVLIFLTCVCGIYSQLSCTYYEKQYYGYVCNLKITNPTGLNNFKRISGRHLTGKTNNDVKYITSNSASFTTVVPSFICKTFKNLTSIELRSKGIQYVDNNAFKDCQELQTLDLYNNKISRIDEKAFENNQRLSTLYLYQNQLSELHENVFINQQNLITLWLDNNYFTSFPKAFKALKNLSNLDLRGNRIKNFTASLFEDLSNIKYLYLQSNQIDDLPKYVFKHLTSLSSLSLSYNNLKVIHSIGTLPNLTQIELSDNQIQAVDEKLIDNTGVNILSMGGNWCANFLITDNSASRALLRSGLRNCFDKYNEAFSFETTNPPATTESPSDPGCSGGNLNKRVCDLEEENREINGRLDDLIIMIEHLNSVTEELEENIEDLKEQNKELVDEIEKLVEEKEDLEEKFFAEIEKLRNLIEELYSFASSRGDV